MSSNNDVARVRDRQELHDLVLRYCLAIDDQDWTELSKLFTEEAELGDQVAGRNSVVDALRADRSSFGRALHMVHGQLVSFAGPNSADGLVPAQAFIDIRGTTHFFGIRYRDKYLREGGSWRIQRREIQFAFALPWDQMPSAMVAERPVVFPGGSPMPPDFTVTGESNVQ